MSGDLEALRDGWQSHWEEALACWSRYTRLLPPRWCFTEEDERREGLTASFAMIRFADHAVVVSLRLVRALGLESHARELLAHEIGHHVHCPADARDYARMLARMRASLPTQEHRAPTAANLYADLLINDRLQRDAGLDVAGVYRTLGVRTIDPFWTFYLRTYEVLWNLTKGDLCATAEISSSIEADAVLAARLVRSCAKEWLDGAAPYAALCLPYWMQKKKDAEPLAALGDLAGAARGCEPDGLAEIDGAEAEPCSHPLEEATHENNKQGAAGGQTESAGGERNQRSYRGPLEYRELLDAAGCGLDERAATARYYRERALPHLIQFPKVPAPAEEEASPEGLEEWDPASPSTEIDWIQSLVRSAVPIPGVTLMRRVECAAPGTAERRAAPDLYIGIDCSGSMPNPARAASYPALAGTIMALSALRAGGRVKVVLSGEPGSALSTEGFVRAESSVLGVLTHYLGTGYGFGVHRLKDTFAKRAPGARPAHIMIISDDDLFDLLDGSARVGPAGSVPQGGWDVAAAALTAAGGGGTVVLHRSPDAPPRGTARLESQGWKVHCVHSWEELIQFASEFSRRTFSAGN